MIDPTLAASAVGAGLTLLSSAADSATASRNDTVNQAEFLQLLITQLQNQDPLNPLDSAAFSSQLAEFTALEQLTQINDKIGNLAGPGDGSGLGFDVLGFLGTQATGAGSEVTVRDGTVSALGYTVPTAGRIEAIVLDESGFEVARVDLGTKAVGVHTLDLGGATVADGSYTVRVQLVGEQGTTVPLATTVSGVVTGVDLGTDPPTLLLGERRLALTDLQIIRQAGPDGA